ncbi:MAG: PIN domain-containing protein [Desulfobacteraceae bacterium]|jgi:predicted nucleic acid-binding protein|nr:PIN domain-containing protein [Desulfobacteraceae bacterium]
MKTLFDTSVLVAAIVEPHPMHNRALPWLQRAKTGELAFFVASHTLAELYAVLTTLPIKPMISPSTAWRLIHDNIEISAKIISLSPSDYQDIIKRVSEFGLSGGIIYDALIVKAAKKSKVERLLTFNINDFKRVWPDGESIITIP